MFLLKQKNITKIEAREVLDSRGNPTIETTAWAGAVSAQASVPSGASTGTYEALELRDGDKKRYAGQGVLKAMKHVNTVIAKTVVGTDPRKQEKIDRLLIDLDGTENKSKLGANAILSVSLAVCRLAAKLEDKELYEYIARRFGHKIKSMPVPLFNVINGGAHADSGLDVQEYFIIPQKGSFAERLRRGSEVYHVLKKQLHAAGHETGLGDEGGFAPHLASNTEPFEQLEKAIVKAGYKLKIDFMLGIDAAASEFYSKKAKAYMFALDKKTETPESIASVYEAWAKKYPIAIIEDPASEDDRTGWQEVTKRLGKKVRIVGDDLFVTNPKRIAWGIAEGIANSALIKVNQIGTVSETIAAIHIAQKHNYDVIISHRSGETTDDFIADLAVAVNAQYIKAGAPARGERLAKYNRLVEIELLLTNK